MKTLLLPLFLCFSIFARAQIYFGTVPAPNDFSIGSVRKSPSGEYFVQASGNYSSIYTSVNGNDWVKSALPVDHHLDEMQFYSDGTPLLKQERDEHLIRRNGTWYVLNLSGGDNIAASFIKDDTLFAYQDDRFFYSIDTGQTFVNIFTFDGNLIDHRSKLWKFDHHFILLHYAGTQERLSVFDKSGQRVLSDTLDLSFTPYINYSTCGHILFNDGTRYYLLKEEGLEYLEGVVAEVLPPLEYDTYIQSTGQQFYFVQDESVFVTIGCSLIWQFLVGDDLIGANEFIWFSHDGEVFLWNEYDDYFTVGKNDIWQKHFPVIDNPNVKEIDEAGNGYQCSSTSNDIFSKHRLDDAWMEFDSGVNAAVTIQYSPNGSLYVTTDDDILYSTDNGHSFTIIPLPPTSLPTLGFVLTVLDDGVLFLSTRIIGTGYYSLNNGQDWVDTGLYFSNDFPVVKLVGDDIMIGDIDYNYAFHKIHLPTNEITSVDLERIEGGWVISAAILDDGTFFFNLDHYNGPIYLRYRFGETLDYLESFPESAYYNLLSSGNNLFAFGSRDYYLFNGETFVRYVLPLDPFGSKKYIISTNEHLFVIVNGNQIYRSTNPLSMMTSVQNANSSLDLTLFPNPATEDIALHFTENVALSVDNFEIIDYTGKIVSQAAFSYGSKLQVASLPSGIYNLVLKDDGQILGIHPFVKH